MQQAAPPHGDPAFGLDRIATLMTAAVTIRGVIALPKTPRAQCLLVGARDAVDERRLREPPIRLRNPRKTGRAARLRARLSA